MSAADDRRAGRAVPGGLVFYLLAAAMPVLFGFFSIFMPFGRDQGIHATIAAALRDGLATYRDVYNIKPPLTTAAHLLAIELFGHDIAAIRIFDLLFAMACAAALAGIAWRLRMSRAGALGVAVGFSALYFVQGYWSTSQTDNWAAFTSVFALALVTLAWRRRPDAGRWALVFVAGVVMGVAFAFKYPMAAAGLMIFAPLLANDGLARFYWRDLLAFVLGGVVFLLGLVGLLAATDTLGSYVEIQGFIRGYVAYRTVGFWLLLLRPIILLTYAESAAFLVVAGVVAVIVQLVRRKVSLLVSMTLLLLAGYWLSGASQGKAITYHFVPMVVVYALLFGIAIDRFADSARAANKALRWLLAGGLALMVLATPAFKRNVSLALDAIEGTSRRAQWETYGSNMDFSFPETAAFSEMLSTYRDGDPPLFVWGYETALYFLQDTTPRYRYPYAWPFAVDFYDGRYTADLLDRLTAMPPAHVVVQKGDATPDVTGRDMDSRAILALHPRIESFVMSRYTKVEETSRFELWQRNDL